MEPFYQLFRAGGASAKESLLLGYLNSGLDLKALNPRSRRLVMFLTSVVYLLLNALAALASEAMTVRAGSTCNTEGGKVLCDPEWVINSFVLRGLQATLALTVALIALLVWLGWKKRSGLSSYPCSITSMVDILRHSDREVIQRINPDASSSEVDKALAGTRYGLMRMETLSNHPQYGITRLAVDDISVAANDQHTIPSVPWYKRVPWFAVICIPLHLSLFRVILLFVLSGNDNYTVNLLGADGHGHHLVKLPFKFLDGTVFGPRFVLSIVALLISEYWQEVEVEVRVMSPYRRLSRRNLTKKELDRINLHGVPFTIVGKALWTGNWFHAFVAVVTVLSYVLVILVAGVPYNYGQIANLSLISSAASVGVLGVMIITMIAVFVWKRTAPKMPRKPDTLVNVWLLLCASRTLKDMVDTDSEQARERERNKYWFGKGQGVDGVKRWMVDEQVDEIERERGK